MRGVVHDVRDVGMTAVEMTHTCGTGWRRWAIRMASAAGFEAELEGT